jgi:hypothetical protein
MRTSATAAHAATPHPFCVSTTPYSFRRINSVRQSLLAQGKHTRRRASFIVPSLVVDLMITPPNDAPPSKLQTRVMHGKVLLFEINGPPDSAV